MNIDALDPFKRDILESALSVFANFGFKGASIEAITDKTQTSKRMIYYHFGSKEGLYQAVLDYAYSKVRARNNKQDFSKEDPLEALSAFAANAFELFNGFPDFVRIVLQENLQGSMHLQNAEEIIKVNRDNLALLNEILDKGKEMGVIRKEVTPLNVYMNFTGLCSHNVSSRNAYKALFGVDLSTPENLADRKASICDAIVRYVKA